MSNECNNVCEACGCAGEIGYIIREGDESVSLNIDAVSHTGLEEKIAVYRQIAQSVSSDVEINIARTDAQSTKATMQFSFPVSVEKLIFELKIRQVAQTA